MNKNWRPEGWENPYVDYGEELSEVPVEVSDYWSTACHNAFEAGASAIIPFVRDVILREIKGG